MKRKIDIHTHKIKYLTLDLNAIAVDNLKSCYNILKYIVAKIFVARMIRQNRRGPHGLKQFKLTLKTIPNLVHLSTVILLTLPVKVYEIFVTKREKGEHSN